MSNEKQMGLAMLQYAQDYDTKLPIASSWMSATYPYTKTMFHCPDVSYAGDNTYGYAFNSKLSTVEVTAISSPIDTPMANDSTNLRLNANDPVSSAPNPPRHDDHNNYVFVDGHIAPLVISTRA